ncbi:amino acid/amide ABC transporter ATP-binding protein 1 (HAAT family) [Georgenia soli]|uniref:Amino acid/amide ABC transporter ATP-binding protein 1 (HAAT family) n=1 Tax=Georgenia soli TaxID=638953 RepID=A0A2A9EPF6_9MICO|nr:ABC transporter ATP-binding protein [Georgenia soli]PFG40152.1 amino acid/amide ABC transporter ATP-binding protein 1 (HAAT family) [Georgenia soli]
MPPTAAALTVESLCFAVGGAKILTDVNLEVPSGEIIGVIGPNGAGKTTLFNMISGIHAPTAGRILLDGRDITHDQIHRRARAGLGRTFQTSNLFPGLSVLENVRLAAQRRLGGNLSVLRFPRRDDDASAVALDHLAEVELTDRADVLAGGLSHGGKRKLEIAVLLAMNPKVILLDEPMAGVARADVPGLSEVIRRMHRDHGCTVLMVEHHIDVVMGLVDRVAVLHQGTILALDEPGKIMADPLVQSAYLGAAA